MDKWKRLDLPKPEYHPRKKKGRGIRAGSSFCQGCEDWHKDSMFEKDSRGYNLKYCRLHTDYGK